MIKFLSNDPYVNGCLVTIYSCCKVTKYIINRVVLLWKEEINVCWDTFYEYAPLCSYPYNHVKPTHIVLSNTKSFTGK